MANVVWKWVGHILRMDKNSKCETALSWTPEDRKKVGRPKNERRVLGVELLERCQTRCSCLSDGQLGPKRIGEVISL